MRKRIRALMPLLATVVTLLLCGVGFVLSIPYAEQIQKALVVLMGVGLLIIVGSVLYSLFYALFNQE